METLTVRALRPPSPVELALCDAVRGLECLPADAFQLHSLDGVPATLRRIVKMARHIGQASSCWTDERGRYWLFIGELARPQESPVLAIDQYGEDGRLVGTSTWRQDAVGQWQRCGRD